MTATDPDLRAPGDRGLTAAEAATRLATDGQNVLPAPSGPPAWRRFAAELVHFFALLFWVASALAFAAGLPQLGVAVIVVILLNALFAFAQEQRAEHAAERLRDLLPQRVKVIRDDEMVDIPAEHLVVGDVVALEGGDRISADMRLTVAHALAVDTSTLTGESVPGHPSTGEALYAGCFVVEGEAEAIVRATAGRTRLAGIAGLSRQQRPAPTPLRMELDRVSRVIALVAIAVGGGFFCLALLGIVTPDASDDFSAQYLFDLIAIEFAEHWTPFPKHAPAPRRARGGSHRRYAVPFDLSPGEDV